MRLTVDLDSLQLIASAGDRKRVTSLDFKRGDSTPLEVQFVRSGVAEELPAGAVLAFGLKENGKYDGPFAVFFDTFDAPTATPDFIYAGTPSFNTTELDALLFVDGATPNDVAFVDLMGELSWSVASADPVSIRTFTARVNNDVIRGTEGTPTELPSPDDYVAARAVLYDRPQFLSTTQQGEARENIGVFLNNAAGSGALDGGTVPMFNSNGSLTLSVGLNMTDGASGFTSTLKAPTTLTGEWIWQLPDQGGELIPSLDQAAEKDHGGITAVDGAGERHLMLWNPTQGKYQGIQLTGAAGFETIDIYDLP